MDGRASDTIRELEARVRELEAGAPASGPRPVQGLDGVTRWLDTQTHSFSLSTDQNGANATFYWVTADGQLGYGATPPGG